MSGQASFSFQELFTNPVFLSIIFSWFSAQFIKTLIGLLTGKIHSLPELFSMLIWRTGGMPSSHSALVVSMATAIGFRQGFTSDVFLLALAFSMVTVRDALGVRRSTGIQAHAINEIGKELADKQLLSFRTIKEVHGHKPFEVIMGCFLGLVIGIAFSTL